jgi:hypothetical protein
MAQPCLTCPFSATPEAEYAMNSGCLPHAGEIIALKQQTGHNWACHSNCNRACQGLVAHNEEAKLGLDMSEGLLVHEFESAHSSAQWRGSQAQTIPHNLLRLNSPFPTLDHEAC